MSDLSLNNAVIASAFSRENKEIKSIDLIMYEVSEKKEYCHFKSVKMFKRSSNRLSTVLRKEMKKDSSFDYKRECEYEKMFICL